MQRGLSSRADGRLLVTGKRAVKEIKEVWFSTSHIKAEEGRGAGTGGRAFREAELSFG